jgi:hypothetical protein
VLFSTERVLFSTDPVADLGATSVFPFPWTSDWTAIHGLASL